MRQFFYSVDIRHRGNWYVVHNVSPRRLYDVSQVIEATEIEEVYQEQEPVMNLIVDLSIYEPNLTRDATTLQVVDFFIVDGDANTIGPSRDPQMLDDSFIDDDTTESQHSRSSKEEEELLQLDSSDVD